MDSTINFNYKDSVAQLRKTIDPEPLYDRLKKHVPEIIEKYISLSKIMDDKGKIVEVLPDDLNIDVSDYVVDEIKKHISSDYSYKEHLPKLKAEIERFEAVCNKEEMKILLEKLKEDLEDRARHFNNINSPHYQLDALSEKYEDARRITLREFLMKDNNKDISDFTEALTSYCMDLCEVEISLALSNLYSDVANSDIFRK